MAIHRSALLVLASAVWVAFCPHLRGVALAPVGCSMVLWLLIHTSRLVPYRWQAELRRRLVEELADEAEELRLRLAADFPEEEDSC